MSRETAKETRVEKRMRRARVGWGDCKFIGAVEVHVVEIYQGVLNQRNDTILTELGGLIIS